VSKLSPRPQLVVVGALGHKGVKAQNFQYPYMCVCVNMYITSALEDENKSKR
jgi:hypothetical protein